MHFGVSIRRIPCVKYKRIDESCEEEGRRCCMIIPVST